MSEESKASELIDAIRAGCELEVICDESNNSQADIDAMRVNVTIRAYPPRDSIIIRIPRK